MRKTLLNANWKEAPACPRKLAVEVTFQSNQVTFIKSMTRSDEYLLSVPVQWLAQFGSDLSRLQAAQRRRTAAGCSHLRRCPKPEQR